MFGVSEESLSPFCKIFSSVKYLCQSFKDYFPESDIEELKEEEIEVNSDNDVLEEDRNKLEGSNDETKILEKVITQFEQKILGGK